MNTEYEILSMLEKNSKLTSENIAEMTGVAKHKVDSIIKEYESNNTILGYKTIVNWDKTNNEFVTAMIEVKITPQKSQGFDKIAQRIYNFPQVKDCYLMSGGFDLLLIVEGKTLREVASFISDKVSQLEHVTATATHFILKRYKSNGTIYENSVDSDREAIIL